ncbi:MAG: nuclear transport factor 2 family protein [Bryobacterales bacterium]|nr:nuclear transport factor 2 family protein [Bryobacterales bacterium]
MSGTSVGFLALMACAIPAFCRCSAGDERALRQVSERWKAGYNQGVASEIGALYAPDAYYLTQHFADGILRGRSRIQAYFQRGIDARFQIDTIHILSIDCSGDLAYTVGRYESTNAGVKARGVNLLVLRKTGGKWLIVAHESAVPDATAIRKLD